MSKVNILNIRPEDFKAYGLNAITVTQSQNFTVDKRCNSLGFINTGDVIVTVNGIPLFPSSAPATIRGDAFTVNGNEMEIFKSYVTISFALGGASPSLVIVQQFYHETPQ